MDKNKRFRNLYKNQGIHKKITCLSKTDHFNNNYPAGVLCRPFVSIYYLCMEEKALFAAGCFWSVEDHFMKLPGVVRTRVGYSGGTVENPSYETVCDGGTGHKEAVEVVFDPEQISYEQLLRAFWSMHNPTTVNQQGSDIGEQYHSVIFYRTNTQKVAAEKSLKELQEFRVYKSPIVTDIIPAEKFYEAEEYHQKYVLKHGSNSCRVS